MANKYKYVCTVFTLFGTAPACVRGSGQRISCMSGTRYRSPDSRPSAGVSRARGRAGCWRIRVGRRCPGLSGLPGSEARPRPGRVVGKQGWPGASRSGATRARVCRIKRVSVCPAAGEGSRMPIRVSAGPKAEERTNAGSAFGRMPGLPGYAWVSQPNRAVGLPERDACCGCGRSAVLARKNEGSPERLPSPSKINP